MKGDFFEKLQESLTSSDGLLNRFVTGVGTKLVSAKEKVGELSEGFNEIIPDNLDKIVISTQEVADNLSDVELPEFDEAVNSTDEMAENVKQIVEDTKQTDSAMKKVENTASKVSKETEKQKNNAKDFLNNVKKIATMFGGFLAGKKIIELFSISNLLKTDEEVNKIMRQLGVTKKEATAINSTLSVMQKSLSEIYSDPALLKQFKELRSAAEKISLPDNSKAISDVKAISTEWMKFKQEATYAVQWIGHYLHKYLEAPIAKIKETFQGLNVSIVTNMPKWSKTIAQVFAAIFNFGARIIKGAGNIFKAIKKIFNMIPGEIKVVTGLLAALALFIKMGPLGKLITIISIALLLIEDFMVFLDGGDSLLGGFWQKLVDIFNKLKDSGVIEKFKTGFVNALEKLKDLLLSLYEIGKKVWRIIKPILSAFGRITLTAIEWLVEKGLPKLKELFEKVGEKLSDFLDWLGDAVEFIDSFGGLEAAIMGVVGAVVAFKTAMLIGSLIKTVSTAITTAKAAFTAYQLANEGATIAQWLFNAAVSANPLMLIVIGIGIVIAAIVLLVKNWDKVKEVFLKIIEAIKEKLSAIGAFFKEIFDKTGQAIKDFFTAVGEWFQEKIDKIVSTFKSIVNKVKEVFKSVVSTIKSVFQPVVDWFKEKIEWIKDLFGGITDKISGAWNTVKGWFGGGDSDNGNTTRHADGGIFNSEHDAKIAEDDKEEALVPLTRPARMKSILSGIYDRVGGDAFSGVISKATKGAENAMKLVDSSSTYEYKTTNKNVTNHIDAHSNYNISGSNPEATANAISHKESIKLRNVQGVIR